MKYLSLVLICYYMRDIYIHLLPAQCVRKTLISRKVVKCRKGDGGFWFYHRAHNEGWVGVGRSLTVAPTLSCGRNKV